MGLASFGDPQRYHQFFETAIHLGPDGSLEIPILALNRGFTEGLFFSASAKALEDGIGIDGWYCSHQQRADISPTFATRSLESP
jgi:hypothetical protein